MKSITLSGLQVNNISKREFVRTVDRLVKEKKPSYVVTPYSEFFIRAQIDGEFKDVINGADLSLADGIGVLIGAKYMELKGNKYVDLIKCFLAAVFNREYLKSGVQEKLSGSEIVYDVCELAEKEGYKVFILGGFDFGKGCTSDLAKEVLEEKYPKIDICGTYAGSPAPEENEHIVNYVNKRNPDILLVAYGPVKQEKWIAKNLNNLRPMVSFALGGTIDYVAGAKKKMPKYLSDRGLEGVLRPFVSERGNLCLIIRRLQRAWLGIIKFTFVLLREKK
ncbi:WecB/TagA/CpsF family glycosyltransferase [Candidatus Dojkabacteria bacterium]|nr:WecB/TagA/CpsF family glycosyltransferase [Candidatus Dojkabacteria bacterium]